MQLSPELISEVLRTVSRREQVYSGHIASAVLMLFVDRGEQTHLVYIRKNSGQKQHGGQMAFPGGKIEPQDASSRAAAQRETYEEIGVPESDYEYLGEMGYFETFTTRYDAAAHVAQASRPLVYRRDPFEVARIFEIPVGVLYEQFRPDLDLTDPHQLMWLNFKYQVGRREVVNLWGLTARITHHFMQGLHACLQGRSDSL